MADIVVIADDLTGANATGVLFENKNCKIATFLDLLTYFKEEKGAYKDYDVISINTDSRSIAKEEAYNRVATVTNSFKNEDIKLLSKRIDSTVRGNVGSEIDAVLDSLADNYLAIVVPAFPASNRITIGGHLLVNSIPLERTDVAKDPKTPVETSCVSKIIARQSKYKIGSIELSSLKNDEKEVIEEINSLQKEGKKIIVFDAVNQQDINKIAAVVSKLKTPVISVDPGPFTLALGVKSLSSNGSQDSSILATIGSATNLTRTQVANLEENTNSLLVLVDSRKLIGAEKEAEIERVSTKILDNIDNYQIVGLVSSKTEEDVFDLNELSKRLHLSRDQIAQKISDGLAVISKQVLDTAADKIGGLFITGGDITIAVSKAIKTVGIEVQEEVLPLAVYGKILGGAYDGLPIVTKGGLIGDSDAITNCINHLFKKIN
jgi:uncharacterized protein YgbK (DUF1537 family)